MRKTTFSLSILAAGAAALLLAASWALGLWDGCLVGEEIRLIDALDTSAVRISPFSRRVNESPTPAPKVKGRPRWPLLEESLSISRSFSEAGQARVRLLAYHVHMAGEDRAALVCAPKTLLRFRLRVGAGARLRFGLGKSLFKVANRPHRGVGVPTRLSIRVHRPLRRARTVFSLDVAPYEADGLFRWRDLSVPLEEFAGQRVSLTIEADTTRDGPGPRVALYLSKPTISPDAPATPDRPNVIILAADALRADHLGCYGYSRPTSPNIDRFSREAVLFENAVSQSSWTLPSFSSMFTSLYPSFHGANLQDRRLLPSTPTLAAILRRAGYTTAGCVRSVFLQPRFGVMDGFDFYHGNGPTTEDELAVLFHWLEILPRRPFFLFVQLLAPHAPYDAPAPYAGRFAAPGPERPDASSRGLTETDLKNRPLAPPALASLRDRYDENILYLDATIEAILGRLRAAGAEANSLIILTSDHGEQFREHGRITHGKSLYQEEIRVPLLLRLPAGRGPRGLRIADRTMEIDILPTALDYLRIKVPPEAQGRSLLPLLRGGSLSERTVFSELQPFRLTAAFQGTYKYVYGQPQRRWRTARPAPRTSGSRARLVEELYDLGTDPGETRNLISQRPAQTEMFRAAIGALAEKAAAFRRAKSLGTTSNDFKLTKQDTERLKALGYLR